MPRMVRNYLPDPIPEDALQRILERARRHPSAGFTQGIHFVVLTSPDRRRQVAHLAGEESYAARGFDRWLSGAPVHVVLVAHAEEYRRRYAEADKGGMDWPVPYWWVDAGAAFMRLVLAAHEEGLGAGFLGAHRLEGVERLLGIPSEASVVGLVTLGRPAPDRPSGSIRRGRRNLEEIVHWETW
ncbi:MAG: nitroreductase family protein [Candidatus Eremiobacterota bacterium]